MYVLCLSHNYRKARVGCQKGHEPYGGQPHGAFGTVKIYVTLLRCVALKDFFFFILKPEEKTYALSEKSNISNRRNLDTYSI